MRVILYILFTAIFICACAEESQSPIPQKNTDTVLTPPILEDTLKEVQPQRTHEEQINFIRQQYTQITEGTSSKTYDLIEFKHELEGTFIDYQRATKNGKNRFMSVSQCSDHGCTKTSYYFSNGKIIFKFEEESHWVGNTDILSEKRTYYLNNKSFKCLSRKLEGPGGYEAVKNSLQKTPQTSSECNESFDFAPIKDLLSLTPQTGPTYFN